MECYVHTCEVILQLRCDAIFQITRAWGIECCVTTMLINSLRWWVTHICVSKQTIIGSDNGLSPGRRQAIIWTNAGILLIGTSGTNFSEILIAIRISLLKKNGYESVVCEMAAILSQCVLSANCLPHQPGYWKPHRNNKAGIYHGVVVFSLNGIMCKRNAVFKNSAGSNVRVHRP